MSILWKAWAATSGDGVRVYGHTFYAPTWDDAQEIADKNGWSLDGEITSIFAITEEDLAMIESMDHELQ